MHKATVVNENCVSECRADVRQRVYHLLLGILILPWFAVKAPDAGAGDDRFPNTRPTAGHPAKVAAGSDSVRTEENVVDEPGTNAAIRAEH